MKYSKLRTIAWSCQMKRGLLIGAMALFRASRARNLIRLTQSSLRILMINQINFSMLRALTLEPQGILILLREHYIKGIKFVSQGNHHTIANSTKILLTMELHLEGLSPKDQGITLHSRERTKGWLAIRREKALYNWSTMLLTELKLTFWIKGLNKINLTWKITELMKIEMAWIVTIQARINTCLLKVARNLTILMEIIKKILTIRMSRVKCNRHLKLI